MIWSFVVGFVAVALRWVYVSRTRTLASFGFDSRTYFRLAATLAREHRYATNLYATDRHTALFPPGLPLLLALLRAFGVRTIRHAAYALSVLGGLSVVLVSWIGGRVESVRVGVVAGLLAAVYPMLILADGAVMTEGIFLLCVCATLALSIRAWRQQSARAWLVVGIPIAAAALTRSDGLLLWPFVAGLAALLARGSARHIIKRIVCAGLIPVFAVTAWTVRNEVTMGYPIPISVNSWAVIGGANCRSTYDGPLRGSWDSSCLRLGKRQAARLDEVQANLAIRHDGWHYATTHLSALPAVLYARVGRTFGFYEPTRELRTEAYLESRDYQLSRLGYAFYLALVPLSIAGFILTWRRTRRTALLLAGPVVMVIVSSLLAFGNQRFRIAAEPSFIVFGAVGLERTINLVARRTNLARVARPGA